MKKIYTRYRWIKKVRPLAFVTLLAAAAIGDRTYVHDMSLSIFAPKSKASINTYQTISRHSSAIECSYSQLAEASIKRYAIAISGIVVARTISRQCLFIANARYVAMLAINIYERKEMQYLYRNYLADGHENRRRASDIGDR